MPVIFAAGGIAFGSWRCHELIFIFTPLARLSSPRYEPHGQHAIDTFTSHGSGLRPISP